MQKRVLAPLLSLYALIASSPAATLNVGNFDFVFGSGNELLLVDKLDQPLTEGFVSLVGIPDGDPVPGDVRSLQNLAFSTWLWSDFVNIGPHNSPSASGIFASAISVSNDGAWTGVPIYLLVGNREDFASSDHFGMLSTGISFNKDDNPPPPDSHFYYMREDDVLIGEIVTINPPINTDWNAKALRLVPVPEPSIGMLSLIALLSLLARRR